MFRSNSSLTNHRAGRIVVRLIQTTLLAMIVALAVQAHAAETRAIQMRVPPTYPVLAKRMRITGVVEIEATVSASGKVVSAKGIRGNSMLMAAAEDAVRHWVFVPSANQSTENVQLNFELAD